MLKSLLSYGLANVLSGLIGFIAVPILARALGPADFARAALFVSLVWVCNVLAGLNISAAFNVKFKKKEQGDLPEFVTSAFFCVAALSAFWFVVLLLFGPWISRLAGLSEELIALALLGSCFNMYFQVYQGYQMMRSDAVGYGTVQVMNSALTAGLSVLLALGMANSFSGRIIGLMVPYVVLGLFALMKLRRAGLLRPTAASIHGIKEVLAFCLPLVPHMMGVFLFAVLDRFFAVHLAGEEKAGGYLAAVSVVAAISLVTSASNRASVPVLYHQLQVSGGDGVRHVQKLVDVYVACAAAASVCGILLARPVCKLLFGAGYEGAGDILAVLVVSQALFACYTLGSNILLYFERVRTLSMITIWTGVLNAVLMYAGFKLFGLIGIAYAGVLAMAVRYSLVTFVVSRMIKVRPFSFFSA